MMLALFVREVFVVREAPDLERASGKPLTILGHDLLTSPDMLVNLVDTEFDCIGHTIKTDGILFGLVERVTFRRCVFQLDSALASQILETRVVNCTFQFSDSKSAFLAKTMQNCTFEGVRISAANQVAESVLDCVFVGCRFTLQGTGAFFARLQGSLVQNSSLSAVVGGFAPAQLVAGFAAVAVDLQVFGFRAVVNVTSQDNIAVTKSAGGVFSRVEGRFACIDADLVVSLRLNNAYGFVGGVVGYAFNSNIAIQRVSAVSRLEIGRGAAQVSDTFVDAGGLCGSSSASSLTFRAVSVFLELFYHAESPTDTVEAAGLVAQATKSQLSAEFCYVLGRIGVFGGEIEYVRAGGVVGPFKASLRLGNSAFCGEISVNTAKSTSVDAAAFAVNFDSGNISDTHATAELELRLENARYPSVAGGVVGLIGGTLDRCVLEATLHAQLGAGATELRAAGAVAANTATATVSNLLVRCTINLTQRVEIAQYAYIALLAADLYSGCTNATVHGSVDVDFEHKPKSQSYAAAIVAYSAYTTKFSNVAATGTIDTHATEINVAVGLGKVAGTSLSAIMLAIKVAGSENANLATQIGNEILNENVAIDCSLTGNNISQKECRDDLKSQVAADALGGVFGWKQEYNNGYPYLVNLPVYDGTKYVLPVSGPFSAVFYYVDGLGYPFPSSDYQICRGACYGTYESPMVRNCTNTNTNNNSYCIQPELAETDFQTASCIQENAHCNSGVSTCTSEAELVLPELSSVYICELGCPGCVNGHCQNNTCVCNLYHSGDDCSTYQCDSDSSACFGDPTMQCAADGSGCVPTDACAALGCVHGSCVVDSSSNKTQCRCDNMWTGSRCDRCNAYGPECSVSQSDCNRLCGAHGLCGTPLTTICTCSLGFGGANCGGCAVGHIAVGDRCVCGDSGGPCQLRQTCVDGVCVADCLLADSYCAECEEADQSVCARCVKQHTIQNGICQFHLSAAVSTSFAVVLGVAGAVAAALGAVLLFRLLSVKRGGGKQKPVGDGAKLDAVQSGPKSVGKAEKPLLEQVPAIQDVTVEIKIDSARGDK